MDGKGKAYAKWFVSGFFYLGLLICVWSADEEKKQMSETIVTAETMDFDYKNFIAVFATNVVVVDPQMKIESDRLIIHFNQTNEIKKAVAEGNVRLWHQNISAVCGKAVYLAREKQVLMTDNAVLNRGNDCLRGDKIVMGLDDGSVQCEGGKFIIFPEQKQGSNKQVKAGNRKENGI